MAKGCKLLKKDIFRICFLILCAATVIVPLVFVIVRSFGGYRNALLSDPLYFRLFWNSVLLTVPILLGQLIVSPMAAFAFETARFRGKEALYFLYIIIMLMPLQLLMVPHYITAELLGYNGTWWAIILPGIFAPFGTFLIRQQLRGINRSQLDAARVDGAGEFTVFWRIVVPNISSTLAALSVLTFADCWNIVDQAVVFIKNNYEEPLSVYLSRLIADNSSLVFSISVIYIIPAVLVFALGHDFLAGGIALTLRRDKS